MNAENTKHSQSIVKPARKRRHRGAASVEYVILLVLIVAAGVTLWIKFGGDYTKRITNATTEFEKVNVSGEGK
jgi:hypothetical protein